ncbi:damage-inducible protein [Rhodococcus sp. H-CA8f]|uniref:DEAD/DEAH box helicase n=1 Tax=Rhodococcus sp. H-CA8f TaxID=1727214 RepID=UPI000BE3B5B0|nr:DEAD/DEAH box helicase [Rhodococcus sp. H-CA8f]ATI35601.1 damage-inducible protein [Rhodococcus sp. H-CA8f]
MPTTVHDIIEAFRSVPTSNRERGDKFEKLMVQYFKHNPLYAEKYSDVWMWSQWPGRDGKPDTGIDLVAQERATGEYCAIQCKFYEPEHSLQRADIDAFFTASGKSPFTSRIIISTTDKWGKNAEDALEKQQIPVARISLADLAQAPIDWDLAWPKPGVEIQLSRTEPKSLRPHQEEAVKKVFDGFTTADRGKLIMACGTGKTFTSLKIAEYTALEKNAPATVLFLVPSISLLSQTLSEWTANCEIDLRSFAVCSDSKVGKRSDTEDISVYDLAIPATTNTDKLIAAINTTAGDTALTVVFSTYQSIGVVSAAQKQGLPEFDLVICDEAHRTTGVTLAGQDESQFVRVHDNTYLKAVKRLYMTATPRLFDDATKTQAQQKNAPIASMDDETLYGPEFHRLGFGEAVERDLLADYKVLILTVDEKYIAKSLQEQVADENNEINLDDAVKIVGCWNGLAKRSGQTPDGEGFPPGSVPMRRAVAFSQSIKASKKLRDKFNEVIDGYDKADDEVLRCEVHHVDGHYNALERNHELEWLKAPTDDGVCRILSNARCLSEGVDVPNLDSVLFLNPRNSVVDVVQSVGRVMRKAEGKEYGYIILPVGIPSGMAPEKALADNKRYRVVWQVLQALRAHDDRFNATVNKIDLNKKKPNNIMVAAVGFGDETYGDSSENTTGGDGAQGTNADSAGAGNGEGSVAAAEQAAAQQMTLFSVAEWRDAVYAKIVTKVGERAYWEEWATNVAKIAERHTTRIAALLEAPDSKVAGTFEEFLLGLRNNLNDGITRSDAIDMLAQHLITRPVFDALFEDYDFAAHNPVSRVMQTMLDALDDQALEKENAELESFYANVRLRAEGIDNAEGKQKIITELYERFFKLAFKKTSESLGIVYTPVEIVDFIIRSVDDALKAEFGASLSDKGVHVLDPFTGTGTFIVRLLQSGLIKPEDLLYKYTNELHANEILLLAYYIAAINIEATFHGLAGGDYVPFEGIVLTDTFQIAEAGDTMDEIMFPQNNARVAHQKGLDIRVIMGNPPYSAGQTSANDGNQNVKYPTLDASIAKTYAAKSTATNKNSLYDSYIRAIRWASDRITDTGMVAYVSNGGYIDGNTADGLRLSLADEFSSIYVYNLRGNQRTSGERSRKEGGKVFGSGSRSTVAILLAIKNPAKTGSCTIRYRDIGDYLTREQKLATVADAELDTIDWLTITPTVEGDWINQRNNAFDVYTPLGEKVSKGQKKSLTVFETYSRGLATARDAWVCNYSKLCVGDNVHRTIGFYNEQIDAFEVYCRTNGITDRKRGVDEFINLDSTKISWGADLKTGVARSSSIQYSGDSIRYSSYRPFAKHHIYFDHQLIERAGQLISMFPNPRHQNLGFVLTGAAAAMPFSVLAITGPPDFSMFGGQTNSQFFPRYTYLPSASESDLFSNADEDTYTRADNITDEILSDFRKFYGSGVSKDDIFYYVYGLLHSPSYRAEFASDLKKMLPRIPKVKDFQGFSKSGRALSELHIGYEDVEPYELTETVTGTGTGTDLYRVRKMAFGKGKDRSTIIYNNQITVSGIPDEAYLYMLGSKSAIEWIMERYQVTVHKDSQICNDPNDWAIEHDQPRYILDLLKQIVTVSVETVKIVDQLPDLEILV